MSEHPLVAFDLASAASTVTKTVIAVLTLIATLLIVVGLGRAWVGRRRVQVVIEDVTPAKGIPAAASSDMSPQLRQAVRQALLRESKDASYSMIRTLEQDIRDRFLRTHGRIRVTTIAAGLRSATDDSLTTLAAGMRAVAPKQAEGLLAALGAALPSQRGWVVHAFPVLRGAGPDADVGVVLELAQLGHPPDAVTTFWTNSADLRSAKSKSAQAKATRALLHMLLQPAAAWIATRLVARQLAESDVPMRWRLLYGRTLDKELEGLQLQLAGQLSLYASRKQKDFDRVFAAQALTDLAESAKCLPEYFRPHSTMAAVHERLGWSYRRSEDMHQSASEFRQAVHGYDDTAQKLSFIGDSDPAARRTALDRVRVRRTKCRLLSGDPAHLILAQQELADLGSTTGSTAIDLYNAACLFAVAIATADLPSHDRPRYTQHAWLLLGCALLAEGVSGPWGFVMTDVELDALDAQQRARFINEIKTHHPTLTPLEGESARRVVQEAMKAIGVWPGDSSSPASA